ARPDPRTIRSQPHRLPARGRGPHGALQLAAGAAERRRVRAAHRRHGPRAEHGRVHAHHPGGDELAGAHLGRGAALPERGAAAPHRRGAAPAGRGRRLPLLLHAGGAGRQAPGRRAGVPLRPQVPRDPPRGERRARRGGHALHRALPRPRGDHGVDGPGVRGHPVRQREHRGLHHPAHRRHAHLQHGRGVGRHRDGDHARDARRGPHRQHPQADPPVPGPGRGGAPVRAPPHDPGLGRAQAQQAPRGHRRGRLRAAGHPPGDAGQLPRAAGLEPGRRPRADDGRGDDGALLRGAHQQEERRVRHGEAALDERPVPGEKARRRAPPHRGAALRGGRADDGGRDRRARGVRAAPDRPPQGALALHAGDPAAGARLPGGRGGVRPGGGGQALEGRRRDLAAPGGRARRAGGGGRVGARGHRGGAAGGGAERGCRLWEGGAAAAHRPHGERRQPRDRPGGAAAGAGAHAGPHRRSAGVAGGERGSV
ncbi:MAG: Glutamyl-tRNA synthetase @ Glutamyl-tRNA(Gln) synthetase, partial [uncultured Gemmatimonadetes bacterium]